MARAAAEHAAGLGIQICVAVVGRDGHLRAFQRMDGAPFLSIQISQDKAKTAAAFGVNTHELFAMLSGSPAVREGLPHVSGFSFLGGGVPVKWQDEVIGGIGVSGGSEERDAECAMAALKLLHPRKQKVLFAFQERV